MSAERIVSKLSLCKEVKSRGKNKRSWIACCPAHDDKSPSLCIDVGENDNVLIHCWAGCAFEEVLSSIGMNMSDAFPDDGYRQESFRRKPCKDKDFHEFVLHISEQDRLHNRKQTKADKEQELESYNYLRGSV